jgi:UDP-4-amino-4,6-dideoxy-N-acetyl-beta-L-altrosamine N-acetyltransferase
MNNNKNIELLKQSYDIDNISLKNFLSLSNEYLLMILDWRNDEKVRLWMDHSSIISKNDHLKFIEELETCNDKAYWLVLNKNKPLGVVYLNPIDWKNKTCFWGYYLNPAFIGSGKGLVLEFYLLNIAFSKFYMNTIQSKLKTSNLETMNIQNFFKFEKNDELSNNELYFMILSKQRWSQYILEIEKFIRKLI